MTYATIEFVTIICFSCHIPFKIEWSEPEGIITSGIAHVRVAL